MIEFKLDPKRGVPFYRQIIDQISFGIATGRLKTGEQLPTVRALAVELSVNPNTISKVYRELEIQNVLERQQGTGTFIGSKSVKISERERHEKLRTICDEFVTIASAYGFTIADVRQELRERKEERDEDASEDQARS